MNSRCENYSAEENRSRLIASLIERVSVNEGTNAIRIQLVDHAKQIDHAA